MEENKDNKIMWLEREDYCPHCHSRKALMIFDKYNNIINYPMVLDQDKPLTQTDFEDFEVLEDDYLKGKFKTYENLFDWYEDNKDETIEVTVTRSEEEYKNIFFYDDIRFCFYSGDNLIDTTRQ